jgi:hypothetical protein
VTDNLFEQLIECNNGRVPAEEILKLARFLHKQELQNFREVQASVRGNNHIYRSVRLVLHWLKNSADEDIAFAAEQMLDEAAPF